MQNFNKNAKVCAELTSIDVVFSARRNIVSQFASENTKVSFFEKYNFRVLQVAVRIVLAETTARKDAKIAWIPFALRYVF